MVQKSGKSFESTSPESAHTVPDLCVPAHTQEPVWKHSSSMESVPISEDTPLVEAASRAQSKAASSVLSKYVVQPLADAMGFTLSSNYPWYSH